MNCRVRLGNCFLRVALTYQPSCLLPCKKNCYPNLRNSSFCLLVHYDHTRLKALPQVGQTKGFSPVCMRPCSRRWAFCLNDLLRDHSIVQEIIIDAKYVIVCRCQYGIQNYQNYNAYLEQISQTKGFSPLCVLWCALRLESCPKTLSHFGNGNIHK